VYRTGIGHPRGVDKLDGPEIAAYLYNGLLIARNDYFCFIILLMNNMQRSLHPC
jgi:hypothetical protein